MYFPGLTSYQTLENSQGTLDPLGLYSIADRLANHLAPSLRERMKHPRYLTAIAVGSVICSVFSEDEMSVDGISGPWQVYEWYVASALVKRFEKENIQLLGLPGREKTTTAKRENIPLNANRYLKTPTVFGFHGVYRTLAKGIDLISENQIDDFGIQLVDTWEVEQGLQGFRIGVRGTKGYEFRNKFAEAIKQGVGQAAVAKSWSWEQYNTIAESLAPKSPGEKEAELIFNKLTENNTRNELINFIISAEGQLALKSASERQVHNAFLPAANATKAILLAIQAYERVCRLLFNAFYESMQWMQKNQNKAALSNLVLLTHVQKAFKELPGAFNKADELLEPFTNVNMDFVNNFQSLRHVHSINEWLMLLFEHHKRVQKNKPPNGKASWILEHTSGNYLLNNSQALDQKLNDEYVHQYRTFTLLSFMRDLKKIKE